MAAAAADYFSKAYQGLTTTLSATKGIGASSMSLNSATNFPTTTGIKVAVYDLDANGDIDVSTLCVYRGTVSGSSITNLTLVEGTDRSHAAGATVSMLFTATHWNDVITGLLAAGMNQDGTQTPVVKTSINDVNGNEVIKTPATSNAVNEITVTNAAANGPVVIETTGGDTNINLLLKGKGTGLVIPELPIIQGGMINGKLVPSVASNNLTVALKTLAGNDPSANDPVYVRIGDTVRAITSALSVTKNAGTNWFNSGATGLATNEIDYFVYIGYNATDGVTIGFARIPYARVYGDFSATSTNEKYCAISTITNAASTDEYEVVGRFNATLSATASFNWSIPATSIVISHPTRKSRELTFTPTWSNASVGNGTVVGKYSVDDDHFDFYTKFTLGSTSTLSPNPRMVLPFSVPTGTWDTPITAPWGEAMFYDSSAGAYYHGSCGASTTGSSPNLVQPYTWATGATYASVSGYTTTVPVAYGTNDVIWMKGRCKIG